MPETEDRYICRVQNCKEDLTEKVLAELGKGSVAEAAFSRSVLAEMAIKERVPWRVMVTCSKGHQNVFHGES